MGFWEGVSIEDHLTEARASVSDLPTWALLELLDIADIPPLVYLGFEKWATSARARAVNREG